MKENSLINLKRFLFGKKGAISIEFAFMTILLCLLIAFMMDVFITYSTLGKLDRVSYSILNIAKERTKFYKDQKDNVVYIPTQQEIDNLRKIANKLLYGSTDQMKAGVTVEVVTFKGSESEFDFNFNARNPSPKKDKYITINSRDDNNKICQPLKPLDQQLNLTVLSENPRFVPLYQVTVCIPSVSSMFLKLTNSLFKENNQGISFLQSSSAGVGR